MQVENKEIVSSCFFVTAFFVVTYFSLLSFTEFSFWEKTGGLGWTFALLVAIGVGIRSNHGCDCFVCFGAHTFLPPAIILLLSLFFIEWTRVRVEIFGLGVLSFVPLLFLLAGTAIVIDKEEERRQKAVGITAAQPIGR